MIYEHSPYRIDVDVEKTRAFYENATGITCNCPGCRNFPRATEQLPQEVQAFFESFGIDIRKPAEYYVFDAVEPGSVFGGGFWHICGTILEGKDLWIQESPKSRRMDTSYAFDLADDFTVYFTEEIALLEEGFPGPVIQLEFIGYIPWALEEENPYLITKEESP